MTTRLTFGYEYPLWEHKGYPPHPVVPVRLVGARGLFVDTYALLDTGADYSLFQSRWARRIGIDYRTGERITVAGVGGATIDVWLHDIHLVLHDRPSRHAPSADCVVGFSPQLGDDPTDQLVGRYEVLDSIRFAIRQASGAFYLGSAP